MEFSIKYHKNKVISLKAKKNMSTSMADFHLSDREDGSKFMTFLPSEKVFCYRQQMRSFSDYDGLGQRIAQIR